MNVRVDMCESECVDVSVKAGLSDCEYMAVS